MRIASEYDAKNGRMCGCWRILAQDDTNKTLCVLPIEYRRNDSRSKFFPASRPIPRGQ